MPRICRFTVRKTQPERDYCLGYRSNRAYGASRSRARTKLASVECAQNGTLLGLRGGSNTQPSISPRRWRRGESRCRLPPRRCECRDGGPSLRIKQAASDRPLLALSRLVFSRRNAQAPLRLGALVTGVTGRVRSLSGAKCGGGAGSRANAGRWRGRWTATAASQVGYEVSLAWVSADGAVSPVGAS